MRIPTLTGAAMLAATMLTGCGDQNAPTDGSRGATPSLSSAEGVTGPEVSVRLTFHEPIEPSLKRGDCPVADGFCGSGEVIPLGQATESIEFGGGCGGSCDLRTIYLPQGSITLKETFSDFACPGSCRPSPAEPASGSLTDVIISGTGLFEGATGPLTGTVRAAGLESTVRLAGTITLAP